MDERNLEPESDLFSQKPISGGNPADAASPRPGPLTGSTRSIGDRSVYETLGNVRDLAGQRRGGEEPVVPNAMLPSPMLPSPMLPSPMLAVNSSIARERIMAKLEERPRESWAGRLFWLLCMAAFVVGLWQIGPLVAERYQYALTRGRVQAEYENADKILQNSPLVGLSKSYELIAQKIRPSVVSIKCAKVVGQDRTGRIMRADGQGSGVVISPDGYVLTNAHVIAGAQYIFVNLFDRSEFPAEIVGADVRTDLAVLKINTTGLTPATWGDSDALDVGSLVWAIGSPYGLDQSVTSGIISGRNRYDQQQDNNPQQELLQTDAAVNPGNSGGPLVDASGKLIGINTSIVGEAFQGISFAVPSAVAQFVADQIIKYGKVNRGFLGMKPEQVDNELMVQLGLPDLDGAVVTDLNSGSPAEAAGIRNGDVIRTWNGTPVKNYLLLYRYIAMTPPKTVAEVGLIRDGQPLVVKVKLGDAPDLPDRR